MKFFPLFRVSVFLLAVGMMGAFSLPAGAHFGMIIPSEPVVMTQAEAKLALEVKFWHPFANQGMDMERPVAFYARHGGEKTDLLPGLKGDKEQGKRVWKGEYRVPGPGQYVFVLEPAPYFEPAEDAYIIHYTKAYVEAFGDSEGWDAPLGLKTEIVPLVQPGALYVSNVFRGRVLVDGKPVPGAQVEVEWYPGKKLRGRPPHEGMVTQTLKADDAGVFMYAAPAAGWWGFAALSESENTIPHAGVEKGVELGAVLWVYFHAVQQPLPLK